MQIVQKRICGPLRLFLFLRSEDAQPITSAVSVQMRHREVGDDPFTDRQTNAVVGKIFPIVWVPDNLQYIQARWCDVGAKEALSRRLSWP